MHAVSVTVACARAARHPATRTAGAMALALMCMASLPTADIERRAATLTGVVSDSLQRPLENAEVVIVSLGLSTRTNAQGRYRLPDIPRGTHTVTVRLLGFSATSLTLTFPNNGDVTHNFTLRQSVTVLDSVPVMAKRNDPLMDEFEENRRLGLGHFITSDELRKQEGRRMSEILSTVPGLGLLQGRANQAWVLSKRHGSTFSCTPWDAGGPLMGGRQQIGGDKYVVSRAEANMGMKCGCYAQVYLDHTLMNSGYPTEPFEVNSIPTHQIEAIEFYSSPAQTPSKYSRLNSRCGVYVIHTRRPPG